MFGQYGHKRMAVTFTTDTTLTSAFKIKGFNHIAIELTTFAVGISTTTANIYAHVCDTATGTFRRAVVDGVYSGGSGLLDFELPSSTGSRIVDIPWAAGYNFMKLESSKTATATYGAYVHLMM